MKNLNQIAKQIKELRETDTKDMKPVAYRRMQKK
jgi:hypothetical protein